jgi:adenosylcobinamide-GDP ribazoletransferase
MVLTRIPLPRAPAGAAAGSGVWAFPLVGACIGALGGLVYWACAEVGLPPIAAAGLALAAMVLATGAIHEDGLADTVDGFGGGRTREEKLAIMRDSRTGTFGVVALVLVFAVRIGVLAALSPAAGFAALLATAALGRAAATLPMALLPRARSDGLAHAAGGASRLGSVAAWLGAAAIAFAALVIAGWAAPRALIAASLALAAASVAALLMVALAARQIGGTTGDVLGATITLADAAALCTIAVAR